jgi:hypothetical protein
VDDAISLQQILNALDSMSVGELRQIAAAAEAKIRDKSEGEKRALKEEMERRAADLGISVRELFGEPSQPAKRGRGKSAKKSEGQGVAPKMPGARRRAVERSRADAELAPRRADRRQVEG